MAFWVGRVVGWFLFGLGVWLHCLYAGFGCGFDWFGYYGWLVLMCVGLVGLVIDVW